MNIEHIRAFLEVASTGSFQVAASKLHITQSAVSARIKGLEQRLNRNLFHRKRNGVELTAGGWQFHPNAVNIIGAWEKGRQAIGLPEGINSVVSLGIENNHWQLITPDWLSRMENELPMIGSTVTSDSSDQLMAGLKAGFLDLAVMYDPQHCSDVSIESIANDSLILVSSHPRHVEDGIVSGYVFVDWGESFRSQHSLHFPSVFSHKLTVNSASVALEHILTLGGSGYFLENTVESHLTDGRLFRVAEAASFTRPVYLGIRQETATPDLVHLAAEAVREAARINTTGGNAKELDQQ